MNNQKKEGLTEILRKSSQLMAKRGFEGTSMRDLAHETGRSLSGLYHYFQSKEDLLYLINKEGFGEIIGTLKSLFAELENPEERLRALVHNHIDYFVGHRDEMRVMLWGMHSLNAERNRVIRKLKDEYRQMGEQTVQAIYEGITSKSLSSKELSRKTFLLFGMLNWVFGWYSPKDHGSPQELSQDIFSMFLGGVGAADFSRMDNARGAKAV